MRGGDRHPFILLNLALSLQAPYAAPVIMMSQNRQQDINRKAAENDYRINVKAELEIELLHEKIDQLREREVLKLTEAVRTLTELEQSGSGARESDAEGGRPSITRGYRLHGVTSFPIRHAIFHASTVPGSSGAQQLNGSYADAVQDDRRRRLEGLLL